MSKCEFSLPINQFLEISSSREEPSISQLTACKFLEVRVLHQIGFFYIVGTH